MKIATISADRVDSIMTRQDVLVVDVRSEEEYEQKHLIGAVNIPLNKIDSTNIPKGKVLVVYCDRGAQSLVACEKFMQRNYRAVSVVGGLNAYRGKYLWYVD